MSFDPDWVIAPGETLKEWRHDNGLLVRGAAHACGGMDQDLYLRIEAGEEPITPEIAAKLHHGTQIPARLWLNLERLYREGIAAGKSQAGSGE